MFFHYANKLFAILMGVSANRNEGIVSKVKCLLSTESWHFHQVNNQTEFYFPKEIQYSNKEQYKI